MDRVDDILAQWRRERPELDVAPMGPIGRVLRLARHLSRGMERTLAEHGLNFASFDVLATLRRAGAPHTLSPGELMDTMMVSSGTMTNRIDGLEAQGLVTRGQNPADGRGVLITLSPRGLAVVDAALDAHVSTQARLVAALPAEDRTALDRLLGAWLAGFEGPDGVG